MWRGYEQSLTKYGLIICLEWINVRGYNDSCYERIEAFWDEDNEHYDDPPWLGDERFHRSHRSKLLQKDYEWYSQYFNEPLNLEYWWPTKEMS